MLAARAFKLYGLPRAFRVRRLAHGAATRTTRWLRGTRETTASFAAESDMVVVPKRDEEAGDSGLRSTSIGTIEPSVSGLQQRIT